MHSPESVLRSLDMASILKMNETEWQVVRRVTSQNTLAGLRESYGLELIALTRGSKGSELHTPSGTHAIGGRELSRVVNQVGAGDAFSAALAAGVTLKRLEKGLGGGARVIRVMPNTPALLGKSMTVVVRGKKAKAADEKLALTFFRGVGDALAVQDEKLLDPVTGLSGSGPAYVYLFAEALIAGGVKKGLSPAVAERLTFQTLEGAVAMLKETQQSPKELREMVTSPGGTTLAGLTRLERGQFFQTVRAAVEAATRRSRELGRG